MAQKLPLNEINGFYKMKWKIAKWSEKVPLNGRSSRE